MSYQNTLFVSGTGPAVLVQGGDLKADYVHMSIEGNWTGSLVLYAAVAGDPYPQPHYATNLLNNSTLIGGTAITQSAPGNGNLYTMRCDGRVVVVSASAWTAGTASIYYEVTQGT